MSVCLVFCYSMFTSNEDSLNKKWCTSLATPTPSASQDHTINRDRLFPTNGRTQKIIPQDRVHTPRSGRSTRSGPVRQDTFFIRRLQVRPPQPVPPPQLVSGASHRLKTQSDPGQNAPQPAPHATPET
jgi:hypothetical protein